MSLRRCGKQAVRRKPSNTYSKPDVEKLRKKLKPPISVIIPRMIRSQNKTTYSHWSEHNRDKKGWMGALRAALGQYSGACLEWSHWCLERIYKSPKREYDFANLVGGAKPLIDSLVDLDIIRDDRPKHFSCDYSQKKGDGNYTIITLLEWANECKETGDL